jgi:hypothetical protein
MKRGYNSFMSLSTPKGPQCGNIMICRVDVANEMSGPTARAGI